MDSILAPAATLGRPSILGDHELLTLMKRIAAAERTVTVYALAHLAEIQRRKLYAEAGYPSMFAYCVGELRYSEATAYPRLQSVDAARKFPEVLSLLKDGRLTICALSTIAKHLTPENSSSLLKDASGKSARDVMRLTVTLAPQPDTKDLIRPVAAFRPAAPPAATHERTLDADPGPTATTMPEPQPSPDPMPSDTPSAPPRSEKMTPRSSERVHFSFTGSEELRGVIARLRELLWHKFPAGKLEDILLEAGKVYLELKDPARRTPSKSRPPRATETRAIPRWVKSTVYRRDGGNCTFTNTEGRRCGTRRGLEYDHIKPWAHGGRSDDPKNIRLLCRAHNQLAARRAGLA